MCAHPWPKRLEVGHDDNLSQSIFLASGGLCKKMYGLPEVPTYLILRHVQTPKSYSDMCPSRKKCRYFGGSPYNSLKKPPARPSFSNLTKFFSRSRSYSTSLSGLKKRAQLIEISLALELSQLSLGDFHYPSMQMGRQVTDSPLHLVFRMGG